MGSRKFHEVRAAHHLEVAEFLSGNENFVDWAVLGLFYAAHQMVHSALSGESSLSKDERHPRKHTSYGGAGTGGRGTVQLVSALFPSPVHRSYRSLFEASLRTRYDMDSLGIGGAYTQFHSQYDMVATHCKMLSLTREDISTQAP